MPTPITPPVADSPAMANPVPEPGVEYPFSISDIVYAAAKELGRGWVAEPGDWGVSGWAQIGDDLYEVDVREGLLVVQHNDDTEPCMTFRDAFHADGLAALSQAVATAIRRDLAERRTAELPVDEAPALT